MIHQPSSDISHSYPTVAATDAATAEALTCECHRQRETLTMIASKNHVSEAVLEAQSSELTNKYAEGYPREQYYAGCEPGTPESRARSSGTGTPGGPDGGTIASSTRHRTAARDRVVHRRQREGVVVTGREFLRAKIHRATVTDTNTEYGESVTVGADLLAAAGIVPFERMKLHPATGDVEDVHLTREHFERALNEIEPNAGNGDED